jgi:regulator of protease activity HflC (stomatin/prohibitin superfamily)
MSHDADTSRLGPGAQAVRISFWFVVAIAALAACAWVTSNVRRIPAESRAVVMRFGALARTQDAGLLIAWPRPFETVVLVPGRASVLALPVQSLEREPRARAADSASSDASPGSQRGATNLPGDGAAPNAQNGNATTADTSELPGALPDALAGSGYLLTGDNGAVQLSATLYYRVADPYAYVLQKDRLAPALERIVSASAVEVVAKRDLDAILVARPEQLASDQAMALDRERLREDLAQAIEQHLHALDATDAGLGVDVARVDVQAEFPAAAAGAFNSVLTSLQQAQRDVAEARTAAERRRQEAQQGADRIIEDAQASAAERVATAQASTAVIQQLEVPLQDHGDPGLIARAYRDRIQQILAKAAHVTTIDPHDASYLILPGNVR